MHGTLIVQAPCILAHPAHHRRPCRCSVVYTSRRLYRKHVWLQELAVKIARAIVKHEAEVRNAETVDQLFEFIAPLVEDTPGVDETQDDEVRPAILLMPKAKAPAPACSWLAPSCASVQTALSSGRACLLLVSTGLKLAIAKTLIVIEVSWCGRMWLFGFMKESAIGGRGPAHAYAVDVIACFC